MKNKQQLNLVGAKEWFIIGDNEFGFATNGLKDEEDEYYASICFLYQQAVEKYLKGFLVLHNVAPEKVHDLGYLCKQCQKIDRNFSDFIKDCEKVSQFYISSRYPTHWQILTRKQAKFSKNIASKIISYIKNLL